MSDDNGNHYPDLEPDGLGDFKEIKRLPSMQKVAPKIRWGKDYLSGDIPKQHAFLEKFAYSMNHAADMLQTERNELLALKDKHEAQIRDLQSALCNQGTVMNHQLTRSNTQNQELGASIVKLTQGLKVANRRIKELMSS